MREGLERKKHIHAFTLTSFIVIWPWVDLFLSTPTCT
ncbi:MAG: hypothetical protein CENE_02451 [Candidatus Celerinatantimonas neptuna]|nr:MAG: hypothetical protein CENE_02451 [Candidatus Celerinatantimonas neptuna]